MEQTQERTAPDLLRRAAFLVVPVAAILAARLVTHTALAAQYPRISALLFLWIAADALALSAIAKAPRNRPGLWPLLGSVAVACVVVPIAAAEPVRLALLSMKEVLVAMGLTVAIFAGWTAVKFFRAWQVAGSLGSAFDEILPPKLVRFVRAVLAVLWLGLFRWNAPVNVPAGEQAFAYHRYLTPMLATFVALQVIELSVVHLLVSLWNQTAALILLALSIWGVIWTIALLKSFRINPVLLTENGIRVRSGMIVDELVPFADISGMVATPKCRAPQ